MATNTFELISKVEVTTTTAFTSVSFTSIPQTYTDLRVLVSARSNRTSSDGLERVYLFFNGNTTNLTQKYNSASGTTYSASYYDSGDLGAIIGLCSNQNAPANQFGFSDLYIYGYTTSNPKMGTFVSVIPEGAGGTLNYNYFGATSAETVTSPITSITTSGLGTSWLAGSTFSLYGILKA